MKSLIGKYVIIAAVLIAALLHPLLAQEVVQTSRYERVQKNRDENFTLIPLKDESVILLRGRDKYNGNKRVHEVILLDSALQEKKVIEFQIEERFPLIGYEIAPNLVYLLFRSGDTNKNSFHLIEVDLNQGTETNRMEIKPELDFKITHFSKVGNAVVMGGYVSNDPAILLFDLANKSLKVVPGFFQDDNELVDLRVNENNTFNVVLIDRSQRSQRKLVFKTFDETGKMLLDDNVSIDDDKSLQATISSTLIREDLMLLGTWGDKGSKQASGFFTLPIDPFSEQKVNYFNFGQFNNFVNYLPQKRAERIKKDTEEDMAAGRRASFTTHVMPFKIEETENGYLLLAEVYNPFSTGQSYYNSPYAGAGYMNPLYFYNPFWPYYYPGMRYRPYPYGNNQRTEHVKTQASVVVAFDGNGKYLWDQSVKLEEVERPGLEQVSEFSHKNGMIHFLYKKESDIVVRSIRLDDNETTEIKQKVRLDDPSDELRDEKKSEGGLHKLSDDSFLIWGYQTIRNTERKDDRVRDVFYINKLVIH